MATATYRLVTSVISGSSHFNASTKTFKAPASSNAALLFSIILLNSFVGIHYWIDIPFLVSNCKDGSALDLVSID